jgi:hypothetical protein
MNHLEETLVLRIELPKDTLYVKYLQNLCFSWTISLRMSEVLTGPPH